MKGLLGRKLGMTQVFTEDGVLIEDGSLHVHCACLIVDKEDAFARTRAHNHKIEEYYSISFMQIEIVVISLLEIGTICLNLANYYNLLVLKEFNNFSILH